MSEPNKNRKTFIVVFIIFLLIIIFLVIDMASRTTAPWNRTKGTGTDAIPGAVAPGALPLSDSVVLDSLLPDTTYHQD
ncbi:hypothetical protein [Salmonirosea aquatica]|uniref:Uncharacterized protein n=1 Tax=Salmonirosea aquatica TaxID=2654236 RepID=A0A7C9BGB9_9BACT|nr:hypothetical protein [Cytophagaceae bacterium SJW1-29]